MTLGEYVKKLREEKGMTSENVCQEFDILHKDYQAIENDELPEKYRSISLLYKLSKGFKVRASSFVDVEARNDGNKKIEECDLRSLLESSKYDPEETSRLIRKSPSFTPWGKEETLFIFTAAKYDVYFKISSYASLKNLKNDLKTAFDITCTDDFQEILTANMIGSYGEVITGTNDINASKYINPIKLLAPPCIDVIHAHQNGNSISLQRDELISHLKKPVFRAYYERELKLSAKGGEKTKFTPKVSPKTIADRRDEIEGDE